jgi:hypothetical protein
VFSFSADKYVMSSTRPRRHEPLPLGMPFEVTRNVFKEDGLMDTQPQHFPTAERGQGQDGVTLTHVRAVGSKGAGELQFHTPWPICETISGNIGVADIHNNHITIVSPEGAFARCFGRKGGAEGQFDNPACVACARSGLLRVAVATEVGDVIRVIGGQGKAPGQQRPRPRPRPLPRRRPLPLRLRLRPQLRLRLRLRLRLQL